ncbi:unnamed protein product [Paramecium octaurelia]|uniref:Protein kinase domain-containing protein n=1 Tax=Paramecium octaurelia TaxID=43137 RepID=A0A8S1Y868_PAROT|nr:unnamed protein product [Paramecium octaurelia]
MQTKAKYDEFEIQHYFGCKEYKVKIGKNNQGQYFLLNFFNVSVRDQLQNLQIIQNLEHPSILKIIQIRNEGIYTKKNSTMMNRSCVIYEYPKGGELFEYLFQTGKFHEAQARHYFKQLVDGLVSIHKQGLYHGELTAEVIFFADAKTIKIGELGLNQIRKKKYTFETPSWAKENNNYEQSKDIFALGMILFILMVGRPPFSNTEKTNPNYMGFQTTPQSIWKQIYIIYSNVALTDDLKLFIIFTKLYQRPNTKNSDQQLESPQLKGHSQGELFIAKNNLLSINVKLAKLSKTRLLSSAIINQHYKNKQGSLDQMQKVKNLK